MIRYTAEQKENALKRMEEIGAKKTQEELGISIQTLYKWRGGKPEEAQESTEEKAKPARKKAVKKPAADLKELLKDDVLQKKVQRLESENAELIAVNQKLKKALAAFIAD